MKRTTLGLTICAVVVAANAFAQVSPQYRDWGRSAAGLLMMKQEKIDWAALKTDDEAKAFVELFWARRDPTPETPVNELRQQIEARIADANKRFSSGKTKGSHTDRGLALTLLGEPTQIAVNVVKPRGLPGTLTQFQRPFNVERWIYRNDDAERVTGTQSFDVAFDFDDEKFAAQFELDGPSQQSFDSTALVIAKAVLKRPFLTAADLAPGAEERTVAFRIIVVGDSATAHDVLRRAQEGENFADLARKHSAHPSAPHGGYVGRIVYADLTDDLKAAMLGQEPGDAVLIARSPQFAIIRLLTEAEAAAADAELAKPK